MADRESRERAIKDASRAVRADPHFRRADATDKVRADERGATLERLIRHGIEALRDGDGDAMTARATLANLDRLAALPRESALHAEVVAVDALLSEHALEAAAAAVDWEAIPEQAHPMEALGYAIRAAVRAALSGEERRA